MPLRKFFKNCEKFCWTLCILRHFDLILFHYNMWLAKQCPKLSLWDHWEGWGASHPVAPTSLSGFGPNCTRSSILLSYKIAFCCNVTSLQNHLQSTILDSETSILFSSHDIINCWSTMLNFDRQLELETKLLNIFVFVYWFDHGQCFPQNMTLF